MAVTLKFKTVKTPAGPLHMMQASVMASGSVIGEYRVLPSRPAPDYLDPQFPVTKAIAVNGSAWAMAVNVAGVRIAWKVTKISKRFGMEHYRMRSVPYGYKGDFVQCWSRAFNGRTRSFSKILWNGGKDGWTIRVYEGQTTKILHEWSGK